MLRAVLEIDAPFFNADVVERIVEGLRRGWRCRIRRRFCHELLQEIGKVIRQILIADDRHVRRSEQDVAQDWPLLEHRYGLKIQGKFGERHERFVPSRSVIKNPLTSRESRKGLNQIS